MTYINIKFAARHKDTKKFLYFSWGGRFWAGGYRWAWIDAAPDFENITFYSARNVFEDLLYYLAQQESEFKLDEVEIIQVKINYEVP
jgi:hypothetical protein